MPERETEVFSNPLPPTDFQIDDEDDEGHALTNDDFRKMLMTPRAPPSGSIPHSSSSSSSSSRLPKIPLPTRPEEDDDDPATKRRKKKSYYAKLKRLEEERQKELEEKYRDRARERRDGFNRDYAETEIISTTADYRAVAPDAKAGENYAERRKQLIQESKYLGGDMEHTHLVKGLDFALLEKVRAEIHSKEREDEEVMEMIVSQPPSSQAAAPAQTDAPAQAQAPASVPAALVPPVPKKEDKEDPENQIQFKTKMGRNVYRILFKNKLPERNELFLPRRMAYVVDLEDEYADLDVPTTTIRSKADCPSLEATTTLTTNDIVINKLTQILSYLRQGRRESKKLKKKEKGKLKEEDKPKEKLPGADDNIYADAGDYLPSVSKSKDRKDRRDRGREDERETRRDREYRDRDRDRERNRDRDQGRDQGRDRDRDRRDRGDRGDRGDRERERDRGRDRERESHRDRDHNAHRGEKDERKKKSYFEKPSEEDEEKVMPVTATEMVKTINDRFKSYAEIEEEKASADAKNAESWMKKLKAKVGVDSYAECYPGMEEAADAFGDSDDEVDYSKMDQGNKKGPIGRWDFDTQEEYSDYMANKEALPKAAFQYGVKMADGRKTRRAGPKDEKAQLDRQWQKIQNILQKRKTGEAGHDVEHKKKKH
ncbi:protein Red-like [Mizuhopecten yessoensis]|uniref:Protein Red n=1 Tax=Mizuhopecten yessoensis TaxID=6573 RepID=A0A210PNL8_MIZYE|nr:protein Red-like [Mizuhopecten yessoensis]OWF38058.1 Protein Red [Mizuhopecten yessoensis]